MRTLATAACVAACALPLPASAFFVQETFDPATQSGSFGVINNELSDVVAFAVANDTLFGSDGRGHEFYRDWATGLISDTHWDAQKGVFELAIGRPVPAFGTLFPGYSRAVVYWAHDILGPVEQAMVASLSWEPASLVLRDAASSCPINCSRPILPGDDASITTYGVLGFYFSATAPGSPFAALTRDFQFVTGDVTLVPEPRAWAMLATGGLLLGWTLRRRRPRAP